MSAPSAPGPTDAAPGGRRARPALTRRPGNATFWVLAAILLLGAVNFAWQLGSSSLYIDEIRSLWAATPSFADVLSSVRATELTPPAYFFFEHEWLYHTHSMVDWVLRLPSMFAGLTVILAVYWLASLLTERRVALGAAALSALSPFLLEFAQRAQGYIFESLAVVLAAAAAIRATRTTSLPSVWLSLSGVFSVLALWTGYTAGFAIAPLCLWVATCRRFSARSRLGYLAVCAIAQALVVPLFVAQVKAANRAPGLDAVAGVTWPNIVHIAGTAFDARTAGGADALRLIAAGILLCSVSIVAFSPRRIARERVLLIALAVLPPAALLVLSLFGLDLMLTRYAAVAAPFQLVLVAAAVASIPRTFSAMIVAAALTVAIAGVLGSHRGSGFYLDARGITKYIRAGERPGDIVAEPSNPGSSQPLGFYARLNLHPSLAVQALSPAMLSGLRAPRPRLWIVLEIPTSNLSTAALLRSATLALGPYGYRPLRARVFPSVVPIALLLASPNEAHVVPAGPAGGDAGTGPGALGVAVAGPRRVSRYCEMATCDWGSR